MKKIFVLPLLLFMMLPVFAQQKRQAITTIQRTNDESHPLRSFGVLEVDKDVCIKKLIAMLGKPTINTTGNITWEAVLINGLQSKANIHIQDGILTHNKEARSACWYPFEGAADKKKKLAALTENQMREMKIEVTDQHGANIIDSDQKEEAARNFLNKAFQKG